MLIPNYNDEIPELTVEVAQAAFPKGNVAMKIRETFGVLFVDEQFVEMYPKLGQPAESPARLALVTILQFMEGLTDREAAEAVRGRIDWKYLLGLKLTDAGFDYSILSTFRQRLLAHGQERLLLEKIVAGCETAGLLKGKKKQRTDSTWILANIRTLNRMELVGETMRRALDDIAQVAPEWLKPKIEPEWGKRYSRRIDRGGIGKGAAKKLAFAKAIGEDGHKLLKAIYEEDTPAIVKQLSSVEVLRQVWVQQYYQSGDKMEWRNKKEQGFPPARKMIASPDEVEARYGSKGSQTWTGYKLHLTETCAKDEPRLITDVATTVATTTDGSMTEIIQAKLVEQGVAPEAHWVDAGYTHADNLLNSQAKGIDLIGPVQQDTSWQLKVEGGYDQTKFTIDWDAMVATCPEGETSLRWQHSQTVSGKPNIQFAFSFPVCQTCPAREKCTRAKTTGRHLAVPPREAHAALQNARRRQETADFKELYQRRAGIEGTMGQAVNGKEARRSRYHGLSLTHLQHLATAAAINLERVARWLMGERPEATRTSPFAALVSPI